MMIILLIYNAREKCKDTLKKISKEKFFLLCFVLIETPLTPKHCRQTKFI